MLRLNVEHENTLDSIDYWNMNKTSTNERRVFNSLESPPENENDYRGSRKHLKN